MMAASQNLNFQALECVPRQTSTRGNNTYSNRAYQNFVYNLSQKETRLEQMKKNPYKRVDSENMTEIEKMDKGFNGKTFSINGMDIDF